MNRGTKKAVTKQRAATMDAFFSVRQVNVHSKKKTWTDRFKVHDGFDLTVCERGGKLFIFIVINNNNNK